jgi:hypothetical protein
MAFARHSGRLVGSAFLALAALLPGQARSQGAVSSAPPIAPAPTTAEQRFAEAQLLFDGQKFAEALPLFEALVGETDSPNARLYVARCLRELGRLTQAYDAMRATVALATEKAKTDDRYVETRDASASELAQLEPQVGHLVVVTGQGAPARVSVGGEVVDATKLSAPVTVLPGRVVVELTRADGESERREIDVQPGGTATVTFVESSRDNPPGGASGGELRWVGIAVGAAGLASFVVAIGTGVAASSLYSDLEEACGGSRCESLSFASEIDEGRRLDAATTAMIVVGAVLAAGSVPLIVFGGPSESAAVSAGVAPGGLWLRGTF